MKTETTCPDKIARAAKSVSAALFDQKEALFRVRGKLTGALWTTIHHVTKTDYAGATDVLVDVDRIAALALAIRAIDDARTAIDDAIS